MNKTAIVTGGTSGIGKAVALALKNDGWTVYELSRRLTDTEGINHITADITDESGVAAAVEQVVSAEGHIDLVVNNAGFGISGAVEFTDTEDAKRLFDTDFFGMVRINRLIIPIMRKQGGGKIINISSVAAPIPIPFQTYYSAAKAAVNSYTMALANEVRPFKIGVCAVQPGDIKTGFTSARQKNTLGDDVYGGRIARSVCRMERDEQNGISPEVIGSLTAKIARKKRVKPLYTAGISYKFFIFLVHILPANILNRLVGFIYAK